MSLDIGDRHSSKSRFSSTTENYVLYRPGYPDALISFLQEELGLLPSHIIADIGSGTGKSSEPFLKIGNTIYAVEPNEAMRHAAESLLAIYPGFISIDASAEHTTLPDHSIDFIVAGQAFHWFDMEACQKEFKRILKSDDSYVLILWNDRVDEGSGLMKEYESFLNTYSTDYSEINHRNISDDRLSAFFSGSELGIASFDYKQYFDLAGLKGRYESCSYALKPEHQKYNEAMKVLENKFHENEEEGTVAFLYTTRLYYGRL